MRKRSSSSSPSTLSNSYMVSWLYHRNEVLLLERCYSFTEELFYKWVLDQWNSLFFFMSTKALFLQGILFGATGVNIKQVVLTMPNAPLLWHLRLLTKALGDFLWRLPCGFHAIVSLNICLHEGRYHHHGISTFFQVFINLLQCSS